MFFRKFNKITSAYVIFYVFVVCFTIWTGISAYGFFCKYIEITDAPKRLMHLYMYRGSKIEFIWRLVFLFILDSFIVFYLIKKINISDFIKYIISFSVIFIFVNLLDNFIPYKLSSLFYDTFLYPVCALFILVFNTEYAVQNYCFWGCWILLLFPFYNRIHNEQEITQTNKSVVFLLFVFDFVICYAIFPQFWVGFP